MVCLRRIAFALLPLGFCAVALGAEPPATGSAPLGAYVKSHVATALEALQSSPGDAKPVADLQLLFDQTIAYGTSQDVDAFREAAWGLRLGRQIQKVEKERAALLQLLRNSPELGHTLPFLIAPRTNPADVYGVLMRLQSTRGDRIEKYAQLTAALCLVHHQSFVCKYSQSCPKEFPASPEAAELFDYFSQNESVMFFGVRGVPAELLVHVVDISASIGEMKWALGKYARNSAVGDRYFDVAYDYDYYTKGQARLTGKPYTLANIVACNGICSDRAHFAASVGKAIGVPTAYTVGSNSEVDHAWVGYLKTDGKQGGWNFDAGRFGTYCSVDGLVLEPQTRQYISSSLVSFTAELISTTPAKRQNASALADAAGRLIEVVEKRAAWPPAGPSRSGERGQGRPADAEAVLELLQSALAQSPGSLDAWYALRDLAAADVLTSAQKRKCSDVVIKLAVQKYPDFALEILRPMIATVRDTKEQNNLWNALFNLFAVRKDLAAAVRMHQARMWNDAGETAKAGQCYQDIIARFANAGPFVLEALRGAEGILSSPQQIVILYEQTWTKIGKPTDLPRQYIPWSVWAKVGLAFADKLQAAGQGERARAIRGQIESAAR